MVVDPGNTSRDVADDGEVVPLIYKRARIERGPFGDAALERTRIISRVRRNQGIARRRSPVVGRSNGWL